MKEKLLEYFNKFVEKIKGYIPDAGNAQDSMLIVIAYSCLIFLIVLGLIWIFGDKESSTDEDPDESGFVRPEEEFDAMAGGFPVPPLPGQSLPGEAFAGVLLAVGREVRMGDDPGVGNGPARADVVIVGGGHVAHPAQLLEPGRVGQVAGADQAQALPGPPLGQAGRIQGRGSGPGRTIRWP